VRMGSWALLLLAAVAAAWGYTVALGMLAANMVGDLVNGLWGGDRRSLIGVPIAIVLIAYLIRRKSAGRGSASPLAARGRP